ncbi:MAG: hypothetical protein ACTXOO_01795 [Sodalis sp. (in: enterobacteria)]
MIVRSLNEYHGKLNKSMLQDCNAGYDHQVSLAPARTFFRPGWQRRSGCLLDALPEVI